MQKSVGLLLSPLLGPLLFALVALPMRTQLAGAGTERLTVVQWGLLK
jgi:hypothetical protein